MPKRGRHIPQAQVSATYERLLLQGYVVTPKGRPRAGTRPLAPALAAELGITERRARQLIARRNVPPGTRRVVSERTKAAAKAVRLQLQQALGTKVEIDDDAGVGTVVVHYSGYAQLEQLMRQMGAL